MTSNNIKTSKNNNNNKDIDINSYKTPVYRLYNNNNYTSNNT